MWKQKQYTKAQAIAHTMPRNVRLSGIDILDWIVGLLVYATGHGFTSGIYSLLLLCRRWMGADIATITDRKLYLINNILKEDYKT